jgi:hypothetical protein
MATTSQLADLKAQVDTAIYAYLQTLGITEFAANTKVTWQGNADLEIQVSGPNLARMFPQLPGLAMYHVNDGEITSIEIPLHDAAAIITAEYVN